MQRLINLIIPNREKSASFLIAVVAAVECPPPEHPSNGKAIYTSTSYNSVVSYECKYGFTLSGLQTRRCGADKKWTGVSPQCKGSFYFLKTPLRVI